MDPYTLSDNLIRGILAIGVNAVLAFATFKGKAISKARPDTAFARKTPIST